MTKQAKKSNRGATLDKKAVKAAPAQKTEKAKTETAPKAAVGKYLSAPSVRPNRAHKGKSAFGDRKWIFRGVTEVDASGMFTATDETERRVFTKAQAEKVLAKCLENKDVVNGRLCYAKNNEKGETMRSVWVALAKDNGDHRKAA